MEHSAGLLHLTRSLMSNVRALGWVTLTLALASCTDGSALTAGHPIANLPAAPPAGTQPVWSETGGSVDMGTWYLDIGGEAVTLRLRRTVDGSSYSGNAVTSDGSIESIDN